MSKELSVLVTAFLCIIIGGIIGIYAEWYVRKHSFKYEVGQCFSNGLFVEKLVDIDHDEYVMLGMIEGKWIIPSKEKEHILNSMMTQMKCPAAMQTDPYKRPTR